MKHSDTIGIWGLGVVGKAGLRYFASQHIPTSIFESRILTETEQELVDTCNGSLFTGSLSDFLHQCDYIYVSPGIDVKPYKEYKHKWISELDIFRRHWKKPIIAVTGSVGKTTLVTLLDATLRSLGIRVATGGNIGIGCLDLLDQHDACDMALLEVSSFQLDLITSFAPDLGIITNIYPNHLDRHGTMQEYVAAKLQLLRFQNDKQIALIPFSLYPHATPQSRLFTLHNHERYAKKNSNAMIYTLEKDTIFVEHNACMRTICPHIPQTSLFLEHVLIVYAVVDSLNLPTHNLPLFNAPVSQLEHRFEHVATKKGALFYNDSKSTVPASTLAAINSLGGKSVYLFLGGLSKGINRQTLIQQLPTNVKHVFCFGHEAAQLYAWCQEQSLASSSHVKLEDAFAACLNIIKPNIHVLFSPAGSSFDLFANYQERGTLFKQLVNQIES